MLSIDVVVKAHCTDLAFEKVHAKDLAKRAHCAATINLGSISVGRYHHFRFTSSITIRAVVND